MFYGALGCFQIVLFALVSVKIKANVPGAHTFPEIMLAFHGRPAHISYLFFGLATNMLVGACLVLGGAQVVEALSGTNVYAANWLIPLVVAAYVIVGGLRSTFIADYIHTLILFVVIFVFGFLMYATSPLVGSPGRFYELLVEASNNMPIAGNVGESYLGFRSTGGIQFAFDLWGAGFTCVFLDQVSSMEFWAHGMHLLGIWLTSRMLDTGLLATSHRFQAGNYSKSLHTWRGSLVRNPICLRDGYGTRLCSSYQQPGVSNFS